MNARNKKLMPALIGALGIVTAVAVPAAKASTIDGIVDVWNLNVSTVFDTTSICDSSGNCTFPTGVTVVDNQSLRWGSGSQGRSGLDIDDSPSNANVTTNGPSVANVSITHLNRPITGTTLSSLDILSTLTLTPVTPPGYPGLQPATVTFKVHYLETPNGANPCADGGANGFGVNINGCADIYVTDNNSLNFPFFYDLDGDPNDPTYQTQQYFISFFELTSGLNPLPATACNNVPGVTAPCLGFRTPEGQDTTVQFASLITTKEVVIPEPGILALLGSSLFGLAAFRRRRSN